MHNVLLSKSFQLSEKQYAKYLRCRTFRQNNHSGRFKHEHHKVLLWGKVVGEREAASLLKHSSIINMVGKKTVSLSIGLGIGSENGIKTISGIPFLLVFKM